MAVVSNSSPIILLGKCDLLWLMPQLYGEVLVPPGVEQEVSRGAPAEWPGNEPWLVVRIPQERLVAEELRRGLHLGEAEAIALALELRPGDGIVLDDARARRRARQLGLTVVGSVGTLIGAKTRGLIRTVRPALECLVAAGLYLGRAAYAEVLASVGE